MTFAPRIACLPVFLLPFALLSGCGGAGSSAGTTPPTPTGTVITLTATGGNSFTTAQALSINAAVTTNGSPTTGTVVLSAASYASHPVAVTNGSATVALPAGVLPVGTDQLTATFTPAASATQSTSASATASITVSATTATAPQVATTVATYPTAGRAFKAIPLASGQVLVSITGGSTGVQLFSPSASGLVSTCVNPLSDKLLGSGATALGLTLFPNGNNVALALSDPGLDFFLTANLTACTASGTGYYIPQGTLASGQGTINSVITPDGKFAFVANEYGVASGATSPGNVGVIALQYDSSGNIGAGSTLVGQISTGGNSIPGLTLSPDGTRLYVTSEITTASAPSASASANTILTHGGCKQAATAPITANGLLTVIDVAKAEAAPGASAVLATLNAGCSPGRAVETSDNNILYITARGDNRVLVFSTGMLDLNPDNALLGYADTGGTAPVGLQLFHSQQLLAVANSNRFGTGPSANATILNVANPSAPTVLQTLTTGLFPREFSVGADDSTLYLTNYTSSTLEVIGTTVH